MRGFHHHPDNIIYVRGDDATYAATLADFQTDLSSLGLPAYEGLPAGMNERQCCPKGVHRLFDGISQFAGEEDWAPGAAYILQLYRLLDAKGKRDAANSAKDRAKRLAALKKAKKA